MRSQLPAPAGAGSGQDQEEVTARQPGSASSVGSPVRQGLAALVIYLAIWVLAEVLPMVAHPGRPQLFQSSMDPNFYTWSLRWWPYAIAHGLNPLATTAVGAPAGYGLAWVTSVPPLALLAFPVTVLAGPVVSFSLLVALSIPVSGWAAFVLCRRLTQRFWPALAAGAIYGFSAYELNHAFAGQLNLTFSLLLPLMAYLVVLWRDQAIGPRTFVCLLALAMALQFYLFIETFADLTAVWVLALVTGYALAGRPDRPAVARLSRLTGLAYLLALVFVSPYLGYALTHVPPGFKRSPATSSLDLAGLVVPRPSQSFGVGWLARDAASFPTPSLDGYVGVPLLLLAVMLAVLAWSRKTTRFLVVMLFILIVAALGPALHVNGQQVADFPWARLWFLPLARSAYPARFMVFAFLVLAVMMALWLAGPSRRPWSRWLVGVLAVAAVAANVPALNLSTGPGVPSFITAGEYRHYLTRGDTVVVISQRGNAGMLWQAETSFYTTLAGGYLNHALARGTDLPLPVARLAKGSLTPGRVRQFRAFIARAKIAAILVEAHWAGQWPALLREAGLRGQTVGGVIVYRTG